MSIVSGLSRAGGPTLDDGSRVGVVGGGPAGSFFGLFVLELAHRAGIDIAVDLIEAKDFTRQGPAGCNMCGGVISESLVQTLATEGINLPEGVVQRGLDSYGLHTPEGSVHIDTPLGEKRIASVHRGGGPKGAAPHSWHSFDGFLLDLAARRGVRVVRERVRSMGWRDDRPCVTGDGGATRVYDLLAVAIGANSSAVKYVADLGFGYVPPRTTRAFVAELPLGEEVVHQHLGSSMHVFLLDEPGIEFGALIPKGEYATLCLVGRDLDRSAAEAFLEHPRVRECLPDGWTAPASYCHCSPRLTLRGSPVLWTDRVVCIGDCGVTRLYKDGIGAAYRAAKAAAVSAVFDGVSARSFGRHYGRVCRQLRRDNRFGKAVFTSSGAVQGITRTRRALLGSVRAEQQLDPRSRPMSTVLWDTFSGSAPYREVFFRAVHPRCVGAFITRTLAPPRSTDEAKGV